MLATVIVLVSTLSQAESYSPSSKIKGMTIGTDYARIQLETMGPAEGCDSPKYYKLATTNGAGMFSALLAAKASGSIVSVQLIGCDSNMPNITHVYLCDNKLCD